MAANRIITKVLQRYWRLTRGLRLEVRAAIRDAGGRTLLIRSCGAGAWHLPGTAVEYGEAAQDALARAIADTGIALSGPVRLFAIYAAKQGGRSVQIALYQVTSWSRTSLPKGDGAGAECQFFDPAGLPSNVDPAALRRINDITAGRAASDLW